MILVNKSGSRFKKKSVNMLATNIISDYLNITKKLKFTQNSDKKTKLNELYADYIKRIQQNFKKYKTFTNSYKKHYVSDPNNTENDINRVIHTITNHYNINSNIIRSLYLGSNGGKSIGEKLIRNYGTDGMDHWCWIGCHKMNISDDNEHNNLELEHMLGWRHQAYITGSVFRDITTLRGRRYNDESLYKKHLKDNFFHYAHLPPVVYVMVLMEKVL